MRTTSPVSHMLCCQARCVEDTALLFFILPEIFISDEHGGVINYYSWLFADKHGGGGWGKALLLYFVRRVLIFNFLFNSFRLTSSFQWLGNHNPCYQLCSFYEPQNKRDNVSFWCQHTQIQINFCHNPNAITTQPNITKVGFEMKMIQG